MTTVNYFTSYLPTLNIGDRELVESVVLNRCGRTPTPVLSLHLGQPLKTKLVSPLSPIRKRLRLSFSLGPRLGPPVPQPNPV